MGAFDIAKDAVRIASTAGLSKDVIDLLEKKLSLLTEEIDTLHLKISNFETKVSHLEAENTNLKKQLQHLQPASNFSKETSDILHIFFDFGKELSVDDIVSALSLGISVINFHFDILQENNMIIQTIAESRMMGILNPA
ncbi:MAG: hypothetical protein KKC46_18375 [Proteobacteria bacterium]|nr:hypothetical protein [Pseudomonadota bacterium]